MRARHLHEAPVPGASALTLLPDLLDPRDSRPEVRRALLEWLSLQAVGALRPRECATLLASVASPRNLGKK